MQLQKENTITATKTIILKLNEPCHEKTCLTPYANNKGADQPAHLRSLISVFVVCGQDSITPVVAKSKISRLWLVSVVSQTPEDRFSCGVAQM